MCKKITCEKCEKITWKGCGKHIEQVLIGIPLEDRCECENSKIEIDLQMKGK